MRNAIVLQQQIVSSKQQLLCHSRQKYIWIHWSWLFFCICFAVFWIEKSADSSDAMNEQNDPFLLYCNLEHADVRIFSGQKKKTRKLLKFALQLSLEGKKRNFLIILDKKSSTRKLGLLLVENAVALILSTFLQMIPVRFSSALTFMFMFCLKWKSRLKLFPLSGIVSGWKMSPFFLSQKKCIDSSLTLVTKNIMQKKKGKKIQFRALTLKHFPDLCSIFLITFCNVMGKYKDFAKWSNRLKLIGFSTLSRSLLLEQCYCILSSLFRRPIEFLTVFCWST